MYLGVSFSEKFFEDILVHLVQFRKTEMYPDFLSHFTNAP